jgi:holliday junction DNA helicase RuvA
MIVGIEGHVLKKEMGFVHVKLGNGLVYKVFISLFTYTKILNELLFLHVTHIVREDQESLYGFWDEREKKVFDTLIKLSGIGPSTALAVCSTLSPEDFAQALVTQNVDAFKSVPGIGPKSAKRILVELGEFSLQLQADTPTQGAGLEASMALESLGFKKEAIKKALASCHSVETGALIKEALQKLS